MAILKAKISSGIVVGKANGSGKAVYRGIPFAKPPVGGLRFARPEPVESWEGERECFTFSPACIQKVTPRFQRVSEDCLYLNVYTPAGSEQDKLPVMVWFFGGGFREGDGADPEFDGKALNDKGVILVTINYRCGIMGFFSNQELEKRNGYCGNVGLLDQIAALKWVQENIRAFGGDPDRVTIFGQSAGGISVRMHLTSPLSKGLFHRAIVESGGGFNEADLVRPKAEFQEICDKTLEYLGWTLEDLMSRDAAEISEKMSEAAQEVIQHQELSFFQPFVDGYVLEDVPGVNVSRGAYHDVPVLCATTAGDSWMFSRKVLPAIKAFENASYYRAFAMSPSQVWGRNHQKESPFYALYFDRTQPEKLGKMFPKAHFGKHAPHGSEIAYVFGTLGIRGDYDNELDWKLSDELCSYWSNFAKNGDPNGDGLLEWRPYTKEAPVSMLVTDTGCSCENAVRNEDEERVLKLIEAHPGMTMDLNGF